MKTTIKIMFNLLITSALFLSSCRVYNLKSITSEDAIQISTRVKTKSISGHIYKFENLKKEDGKYYGIAKKNSKTSKKLFEYIVNENSNYKYAKILLTEDLINEIYTQNQGISTLTTILFTTALTLFSGFVIILFSSQ